MFDDISVIVPSLNPDEKLGQVADALIEEGYTDIILVNDGSDELHSPVFDEIKNKYPDNITVLTHEVNKGKGRAMKTAFAYVCDNRPGSKGAVTVDGDNQHRAKDVTSCVKAMLEKDALILGCRDFSLPQVPFKSRNGNRITRAVFKFVCGIDVSDTQTGLRAFPGWMLPRMIEIDGDRYEFETNMLLVAGKEGLPYGEVPIETVYIEDNKSSHFHPFRDSARIYFIIFKFAASSIISCVLDLAVFRIALAFMPEAFAAAKGTTIAGIIARVISSAANFTINKKAVFKSDSKVGRSLVRYYILAVCQLGLSLGAVGGLVTLLGVTSDWLKTLIKMVVDVILFFVSFRIQRAWVFAGDKKDMKGSGK